MKRILLGLCCALILSGIGPVPVVSAHGVRLWHRHHKDAAATKTEHKEKGKRHWLRHERANHEGSAASYSSHGGPRSVGFRHAQPGPAGAGG